MIGAAGMAAPVSIQKGKTVNRQLPMVNSSQLFINRNADANALTRKAPTRASDLWLNWGYNYGPYTAFQMNYTGIMKEAIMLTKNIATEWAGAEITAVQVANPIDNQYLNPLAGNELTVWLAESLDSEPICSGKGVFTEYGFDYTSIELDKSYTLVKDTPVYIGCTFNNPNPNDIQFLRYGIFTLVTDYTYPENAYSAYLYSPYEGIDDNGYMVFGDEYSWKQVGTTFGNLCITATISGDMLPTNQIEIADYQMPAVVKPGVDFDIEFTTVNYGANQINTIDLTLDIEGQEPQVKQVELNYAPIAYEEYSEDTVSFSCSRVGNNLPYKLYVSAINGEPVQDIDEIEGYLICISNGFDRNVVIEEATGTWCGWCVIGYAGMEYMNENYSDKGFIGIAMHQGDAMAVLDTGGAYNSFIGYISGFPSSFMNRNWAYNVYPSPEVLEYEFLEMVGNPSFAKIDAELIAEEESRNVTLNTTTMFAEAEDNANYGVAYAVIENNVGPYVQQNYASGENDNYYGFENENSAVPLIFNDVARNCSHPLPFANSLPTKTEANTPYEYSMDINLRDVSNLNNYRIVAMVIDGVTGYIQNACEVSPTTPSSIQAVKANEAAFRVMGGKGLMSISNEVSANVYTTDGRIVAKNVSGNVQLPAGMYIVAAGNKAAKVVVR